LGRPGGYTVRGILFAFILGFKVEELFMARMMVTLPAMTFFFFGALAFGERPMAGEEWQTVRKFCQMLQDRKNERIAAEKIKHEQAMELRKKYYPELKANIAEAIEKYKTEEQEFRAIVEEYLKAFHELESTPGIPFKDKKELLLAFDAEYSAVLKGAWDKLELVRTFVPELKRTEAFYGYSTPELLVSDGKVIVKFDSSPVYEDGKDSTTSPRFFVAFTIDAQTGETRGADLDKPEEITALLRGEGGQIYVNDKWSVKGAELTPHELTIREITQTKLPSVCEWLLKQDAQAEAKPHAEQAQKIDSHLP
jgi:hypothetical protein